MNSTFGKNLRVSVFGESHGEAVGAVIDGFPHGVRVDFAKIGEWLARRAPGGALASERVERDQPHVISGMRDGVTTGAPLCVLFANQDAHSDDYAAFSEIPRPSHADYPARVKYDGCADLRGGGHFSGRLTLPLTFAGALCMQVLEAEGVQIDAHLTEPTVEKIQQAKENGDSVGGIIACTVTGLPVGLGDAMFRGVEGTLAAALYAIPAVKGVEFGLGFAYADVTGSEANDAYCVENDRVVTKTNHCGGVVGGMTTGMPVYFQVACKPTPSIARPQKTLNLATGGQTALSVTGRHDPCLAFRAVPVVACVSALALLDLWMDASPAFAAQTEKKPLRIFWKE